MKYLIQYLTILLICNSINGQVWFEVGTEWNYTQTEFLVPGEKVNTFNIVSDTIIQDIECKKLMRTTQTCDERPIVDYLYTENDSVYYYSASTEAFELLYDFSAEAGDTIRIKYWENFESRDSFFYIRVDTISDFQLNTLSLKQMHVTYDRWDDEEIDFDEDQKGLLIEGVGSLTNLFYFEESGICDWKYNKALRCYTHPSFGEVNFIGEPCQGIINSREEIDTFKKLIRIYPNPSYGVFQIDALDGYFDRGVDLKLLIHAANGQLIQQQTLMSSQFHLAQKGLAFIQILNEDGERIFEQMVVVK